MTSGVIAAFFDELDKLSAAKAGPNPADAVPSNGSAPVKAPSVKPYVGPRSKVPGNAPVASPKPSAIASVSPGVTPNTARQASVPPKAPFPADQFAIT